VYPGVIEKHLREELPFLATENILMEAVKKGGDRQLLHEKIRQYSMEAQKGILTEGAVNNLLERILADSAFKLSGSDMKRILNVSDFVGRAPEQVVEFVEETIDPLLERAKKFGTIVRHEIKV